MKPETTSQIDFDHMKSTMRKIIIILYLYKNIVFKCKNIGYIIVLLLKFLLHKEVILLQVEELLVFDGTLLLEMIFNNNSFTVQAN